MQNKTGTIIVTGGAGFIGSHLCDRLLDEGEAVLCVDSLRTGRRENLEYAFKSDRFSFLNRDVLDLSSAKLPLAKTIYHLACPASPPHYQADPVHTMMTCVAGTQIMLECAVRNGARFLLASTSEVYGDPEEHPQSESYRGAVNIIGPRACYDEGKRAAEALCYDYARKRRAPVRVARIFNTYGPRMRPDDGRVISNFVRQALRGEPLTIYGDGEQTRSFCYVEDLVAGLISLMNRGGGALPPVNLGNPEECTVRELAQKVCKIAHVGMICAESALPADDPRRRRPDISRAMEILGWRPRTSLDAGLRKVIAACREEVDGAGPMPNAAPAGQALAAE